MWRAGEAGGDIWRMSFEQLRDGVVDMGLMDAAEADAAIALCSDPRFSTLSPVMMAAWAGARNDRAHARDCAAPWSSRSRTC